MLKKDNEIVKYTHAEHNSHSLNLVKSCKVSNFTHHTTACMWLRFASPKFTFRFAPCKLHIHAHVVKNIY